MENVSHSSKLPRDVTVTNDDDEAFLGDMLSLSQFNVGCEIGKGQFSQVLRPHSFMFAIFNVVVFFRFCINKKGLLCHVSALSIPSSRH